MQATKHVYSTSTSPDMGLTAEHVTRVIGRNETVYQALVDAERDGQGQAFSVTVQCLGYPPDVEHCDVGTARYALRW